MKIHSHDHLPGYGYESEFANVDGFLIRERSVINTKMDIPNIAL